GACSSLAIRRRRRLRGTVFLQTWPCFESAPTGGSNSCSATTSLSVRSRSGGPASCLSGEAQTKARARPACMPAARTRRSEIPLRAETDIAALQDCLRREPRCAVSRVYPGDSADVEDVEHIDVPLRAVPSKLESLAQASIERVLVVEE